MKLPRPAISGFPPSIRYLFRTVRSNLRHIREQDGVRQVELARKSGLSDRTIRNAERGRVSTPTTLYKVLNAHNSLTGKDYDLGDLFPGAK